MSGSDRQTDRIVRAWLEDGVTQFPDRLLDGVLDQIPNTRQRQPFRLTGRFAHMSTSLRIALAGAAAVIVVAGGAYLFTGRNAGAPVATPTPTPTTAPAPTATPDAYADQIPSRDIALEPGSYSYYESFGGQELRVILTVPAGWTSHESWYVYRDPILSGGGGVAVAPWLNRVNSVFPDPCSAASVASGVATGSTAAELAGAFTATSMHDGVDPIDITVSGYAGKEVHISTDPAMDVATCVGENISPWWGRHVVAGTEQTLWILDVEGSRLVIDASAEPGADATQRAELQQVLESIQIEVN